MAIYCSSLFILAKRTKALRHLFIVNTAISTSNISSDIQNRLDKSNSESGAYNAGIEFTLVEDCTAGTFCMNPCPSRDHLPWVIYSVLRVDISTENLQHPQEGDKHHAASKQSCSCSSSPSSLIFTSLPLPPLLLARSRRRGTWLQSQVKQQVMLQRRLKKRKSRHSCGLFSSTLVQGVSTGDLGVAG